MESVKNQILLPEVVRFDELVESSESKPIAASETAVLAMAEFRELKLPVVIPTSPVEEKKELSGETQIPQLRRLEQEGEASPNSEAEVFSLPKHFWRSLTSDRAIQQEIDRIIEEQVESRVLLRLESRFKELRGSVEGEAKNSGYAVGYLEGRRLGLEIWEKSQRLLSELQDKLSDAERALELKKKELSEGVSQRLNHLIQEFLEQKECLLKAHEKMWATALVHLLQRFLINNPIKIGSAVERWLVESVSDFASKSKISVCLPEVDYVRQMELASPKASDKWELVKDPLLSKGEIRYECGGGGIFFSGTKEYQELEELLQRILKEGDPDVA